MEALKEGEVFREWFDQIIAPPREDRSSESLLLVPWAQGKPDYRDCYRERPRWAGEGFYYFFIAPFAQAPDMVFPSKHARIRESCQGY